MTTITPYLTSPDGEKQLQWLVKVFGAEVERKQTTEDKSKIVHCTVKIGEAQLMFADDFPDQRESKKAATPAAFGGSPISLSLHVKDAGAVWKTAMDNGAVEQMKLEVQFWGDKYGKFKDPFGFEWQISETVKKVEQEELDKACAEAFPDHTNKKRKASD
eukprot:TRINITY_DN76045_c0_g1_i1.p2 TRINITY_DN76045_c0_g1~~TRINITY_DN76045_c0_g1_i1.p2  ORF type:complete len:160 (+),score=47.16 TRINITY_DN76045_c0_g1_i1:74-553(+)